jgi:hypothetical protein
MRIHNFLVQPAVFIRRRALRTEMVDAAYDFMMDWELWLRLASDSRFVHVNRILAVDRHQPTRKVVTRPDLAIADEARLRDKYQFRSGPLFRITTKSLKLGLRSLGVMHITEASTAPLAFDGRVDGGRRLLLRQLTVPRSRMPFES